MECFSLSWCSDMQGHDDKIALFKMLDRHAGLGFHIMYICIKRDKANPLGHDSAAQKLEKCGKFSRVNQSSGKFWTLNFSC